MSAGREARHARPSNKARSIERLSLAGAMRSTVAPKYVIAVSFQRSKNWFRVDRKRKRLIDLHNQGANKLPPSGAFMARKVASRAVPGHGVVAVVNAKEEMNVHLNRTRGVNNGSRD
jgi:hypothetical protein